MTSRFWILLVQMATFCASALPITAAQADSATNSSPDTFEPALRDLWTRGSERFHRQWLIAGPLEADLAATIDAALLEPAIGQELTARDSRARWTAHTSWSDVIDLSALANRAPGQDDQSIDRFVFAAASLPSAAASRSELSIGSERPYSVWLNGKLVHTHETAEAFAPDRDRIPVELKQGENFVLLRFHETSAGSSQFSVRAVPPGSALKRIGEVTPSIADSSDEALAVRTHFATQTDASPVVLEVVGAGGNVVAEETAARGEVVKFDPKDWPDGAYEIRVSAQDAWKRRTVRHLAWYKGDSIAAVRRLIEVAEKASDDARGDTLRMLAALAKDRLGGPIEKASRSSWRLVHSPLLEFEELQLEARGRQGRVRAGGFVRIAYVDEVDGSTQFCRAFLPTDYSSGRQWPLIAFLHGYNPANPEYVDWWGVDERHNPVADTKETIVLEPHGRGNAQYSGIGERDVLRCIDEARRHFSVDADRIYLTGESMGGHGTWLIASRHPDLFAAAAPVYGGWDFRITSVSGPATAPAPQTELDAFSLERASSFANAENLLHVPLLVVHGDADKAVSVENSRHAVRLLQRWGYNVRYHEMPGWAHEDLGQRSAIADWLLTHERVASPATIRLRSPDLAGASAYWLSVRAYENPSEVIRVSAEVLQPGIVRIDSTNVSALAFDLPASLRGSTNKVQVVWNGQDHQLNTKGGIAELGVLPNSSTAHKRAGSEGPLPAVLATPFAVVVGTISPSARMRELIQSRADSLAQQWLGWQHQPLRMLKDTEVSAEHEKAYSLILLGGAAANAVTKRFAKKLPFSASREGIAVDGHEWKVTDSVLQVIYPSPAAADRYVYVVAATSPEGMYFWKPQLVHFVQGYPVTMFDWVIQDGRRPPPGTMDPAAANVASGVFDASWRRQDRWTVVRNQERSSQWTLRRAPPKDFVASPSALQANAGRYELFPGFVLTVRVEGSNLVVDVPGEPSIPLISESDSVFVIAATGDAVEFLRDEKGNVRGASVDSLGVLLAKRLP